MSNEGSETAGPLTGWEATASPMDTALRQFLIAQTAFQRMSGEALGATILENEQVIAVDSGQPATMINFALIRQPLTGPAFEPTMESLEELYGGDGKRGFVALYSPLPTPDLSPWGWSLAGHPPLQLRSRLSPRQDIGKVKIEGVTTGDQQTIFERIIIDGFEFEEMRARPAGSLLGAGLFEDERFRAFLGYVDGEPVSAAASVTEAGIVDIVMVATIPSGRRQGAGLAVTQAATRLELGLPGVLFSSDEGRPVYERLGFVPILRGSFWYRNR